MRDRQTDKYTDKDSKAERQDKDHSQCKAEFEPAKTKTKKRWSIIRDLSDSAGEADGVLSEFQTARVPVAPASLQLLAQRRHTTLQHQQPSPLAHDLWHWSRSDRQSLIVSSAGGG